jgi:hypothetical protein
VPVVLHLVLALPVILTKYLSHLHCSLPADFSSPSYSAFFCCICVRIIFTGILTQSDELHEEVAAASEVSGEKFWRLPFEESYWDSMKSGVADMLNTGAPQGGAITAALFLKQVCIHYSISLLGSAAYLHFDYWMKVEHCSAVTWPFVHAREILHGACVAVCR